MIKIPETPPNMTKTEHQIMVGIELIGQLQDQLPEDSWECINEVLAYFATRNYNDGYEDALSGREKKREKKEVYEYLYNNN